MAALALVATARLAAWTEEGAFDEDPKRFVRDAMGAELLDRAVGLAEIAIEAG